MRLIALLALGLLISAVGTFGCRLLLGTLDECESTKDCASMQSSSGQTLTCQSGLCVSQPGLDPRCQIIGSDAGAGPPVRIGAILPMTLPGDAGADPRGTYRLQAVQLAFQQLSPPVRGGIGGRSVQVIACDNQGDSTQAAALSNVLVAQGVPAIVGATSSDVLQEVTVTLPNHVLLISSSATAAEIATLPANDSKTGVRMVWRTVPSDAIQGAVMARVLANGVDGGPLAADAGSDGAPTLGVFEVNSAYGQGLYAAIQGAYPGSATNVETYTQGGDVSAALKGVESATPAPQVLVAIAFPGDAVNLINGAAGSPATAHLPWFFSDAAKEPTLFTGLKNAAQISGALGTAPAVAQTSAPAFVYFDQQFKDTYGTDPLSAADIPNTWDAAMLLALAAQWASPPRTLDGPTMAEALTHMSNKKGAVIDLDPMAFGQATQAFAAGQDIDVNGASGPLDFNAQTGEAPADIEVWQVADGGFTTVAVISP